MAMHIGETKTAALEAVGETLVIDAEKVHESGVEIVNVDRVLDDVVAVLVGLADRRAGFDAAAGEPHAEAAGMMIATEVVAAEFALGVVGATKFAAPDDKGVLQHAALFQILNETGRGLVGFLALFGNAAFETAVLVPTLVIELDEFHPALGHASGHEAIVSKAAGFFDIGAVELFHGLGLAAEVGGFGDGGLHPVGHFILGDAGIDLGIAGGIALKLVQFAESIQHEATTAAIHAVGILQVEYGVFVGPESNALVATGQKSAAPETGVEGLATFVLGDENDEGREVFVVTAEPVVQPRADAGTPGNLGTGLEKGDGGVVIDRLGVERFHDAEVIDHLGGVRQDAADPGAAFAVLLELERRTRQRQAGLISRHAGQALALANRIGQLLAVLLIEQRLVVKGIEMRGAAGLKQVDDTFHLGRQMRLGEHAAGGGG